MNSAGKCVERRDLACILYTCFSYSSINSLPTFSFSDTGPLGPSGKQAFSRPGRLYPKPRPVRDCGPLHSHIRFLHRAAEIRLGRYDPWLSKRPTAIGAPGPQVDVSFEDEKVKAHFIVERTWWRPVPG